MKKLSILMLLLSFWLLKAAEVDSWEQSKDIITLKNTVVGRVTIGNDGTVFIFKNKAGRYVPAFTLKGYPKKSKSECFFYNGSDHIAIKFPDGKIVSWVAQAEEL